MAGGGLKRSLSRTFGLQAAAIGIATVLGILTAGWILEEILITQALTREAEYFWSQRLGNPDFALPDTHNLTGLMDGVGDGLPAGFETLGAGFHSLEDGSGYSTVYVSEQEGQRLYLVFDGDQVGKLATWFGLVPLALVLLVLYLSVWFAYRLARRAVSPVIALADRVNLLDPDAPDADAFAVDEADDEVRILSGALARFAGRLSDFVERERTFTRDASHELRTPLTVIRVATDMLLSRGDLPETARRDIDRIRRSADDMQELVEAFLLLAREAEKGLPSQDVSVNAVLEAEIDRLQLLVRDRPVAIRLQASCQLVVNAPERVLSIMLGNLLRNAVDYTESGEVRVVIEPGRVSIQDSGVGMDSAELEQAFETFFRASGKAGGHGIGLSIVKRLSERFDWPVTIQSRAGVGTRVDIGLPRSRAIDSETGVDAGRR